VRRAHRPILAYTSSAVQYAAMPDYRRAQLKGGTYFFTLTSFKRRPILTDEHFRFALRQAILRVKTTMPFESIAWVLLPDHLHTIWQLPEGDTNFSTRWSMIKRSVTQQCKDLLPRPQNLSRQTRREGTLWQRRFWEHLIRDELDLQRHIDYIHYNPVKHGYVSKVTDWPYSTFHRYVQDSIYPKHWASAEDLQTDKFGE